MKEDNIIQFKKKNKLTDAEINGLFLGLVKLVKKLAIEEAGEASPEFKLLRDENQQLQQELSQKENEIEKLKAENQSLKNKIKVKNLRILQLSCSSAKSLAREKI